MRKTLLAAALVLFLPALAHAQAWSTISLLTSADGAQQLVLRDNDGTISGRISVTNLLPDNPVTGVSRTGSTLTFTFEDGSTQDVTLPSTGSTTPGLTPDQARDTAGALVATLPLFNYNASSNVLSIQNNSLQATVAQNSTSTAQQAWQTRLGIAQDWSTIPNGTLIRIGKVAEHGGAFFGAITQHSKSSTGPDGDPTNWTLLSSFYGGWQNQWYPSGSITTRAGLPYVATSAVVRGDPAPDATTNTKWLALGSAPTAVVIASSNTSIPASANGNTYVHTGSSNITYTLPAASGGTAVANGWEVVITNQGAGDLTIDGNGSDTVDGSATLVITDNGRSVRVQKIANTAWATIADTKDETGSSSAGLNQSEVDARIATYARATPSGTIADAQIPAAITRDTELDARVSSAAAARIPAAPPTGTAGQGKVWKTDSAGAPGWRDDAAGTGGAIADNSILPVKAQASTAAQQRAWRERLASSRIGQVSAALPAVADYNAGDLLIVGRGGTTTVTFVNLDAPATQLTTTVAGDLMMVLSNRWTRLGNLFSGGIAAAAAQATANAAQATADAANTLIRKIASLSLYVDPGVVEQQAPATRVDAIVGDYRLVMSPPDILAGEDVWVRVFSHGSPLHTARVTVDTSPTPHFAVAFAITRINATNIVNNDPSGDAVEVDVLFYSSNSDAGLIETRTVSVDVVQTPRVDDRQEALPNLGNDQIWISRGAAPVAESIGTIATPVLIVSNIASFDATQDRFEDSSGNAVATPNGSIVTLTQAIYDAAVADAQFTPNANAIFLTR